MSTPPIAPTTPQLEQEEALAALGASAPRVALDDIRNRIASIDYLNVGRAIAHDALHNGQPVPHPIGHSTDLVTLCIVTMANGFVILGKSACASPQNFDRAKGEQIAYEDAVSQAWAFEGYLLRERLSDGVALTSITHPGNPFGDRP